MFEGSRLRINRANHHIRDLKAALESYCKNDFCRIGVDTESKQGVCVVRLERTRELPGEIPLILADAIHNLRASLDFLACDIVRSGGKQPTRYTRFVFESTREKLMAALEAGTLKAARPDLIELIVDTIKPYKGGDESLYGLNDLDVDERNRSIVPVVAVVAMHNVRVRHAEGNIEKIAKLEVDPSGEFRLPDASGKVELASYEHASFQALFDKGNAFEGQPIVPTLHRLSLMVAGVVDTVQQAG
jgi:hypothetical protein